MTRNCAQGAFRSAFLRRVEEAAPGKSLQFRSDSRVLHPIRFLRTCSWTLRLLSSLKYFKLMICPDLVNHEERKTLSLNTDQPWEGTELPATCETLYTRLCLANLPSNKIDRRSSISYSYHQKPILERPDTIHSLASWPIAQ